MPRRATGSRSTKSSRRREPALVDADLRVSTSSLPSGKQDRLESTADSHQEISTSAADNQGFNPYPSWPSPPPGTVEESFGSVPGVLRSPPELVFRRLSNSPPPGEMTLCNAMEEIEEDQGEEQGFEDQNQHVTLSRTSAPSNTGGVRDSRGERCEVAGCQSPPSYSEDGSKPAVLCGNHRRENMHRVQHQNRSCGHDRCKRKAAVSHMSQNGRIYRYCSEHKKTEVVATKKTPHCEHPHCSRHPKYGSKEGPLNFCPSHKRAGMFTNRSGKLLVATRDGDAFTPAGVVNSSRPAAATHNNTASSTPTDGVESPDLKQAIEIGSSSRADKTSSSAATTDIPTVSAVSASSARKVCEVPGCLVQPSYGISGTNRPQFCSGHKKKGMVGLKNRPCCHPGCDIRPHYGMLGSKPLYCVTHKKRGMVHLFRQAMAEKKEADARKRKSRKKVLAASSADQKSDKEEKKTRRVRVSVQKNKAASGPVAGKGKKRKAQTTTDDDQQASTNPDVSATAASTVPDVDDTNKEDDQEIGGRRRVSSKRSRPSKSEGADIGRGEAVHKDGVPAVAGGVRKRKRVRGAKGRDDAAGAAAVAVGAASPEARSVPREAAALTTVAPTATEDTVGVPPSVESGVLKRTRAAKAEADESGSGRRPRAPSRKALEAQGRIKNDAAQWMTKDIKEADARQKKEMREQRRRSKAAGLRAGVVLELYTVGTSAAATNEERIDGNSGGGDDGGSGSSIGSGSSGGGKAAGSDTPEDGSKESTPSDEDGNRMATATAFGVESDTGDVGVSSNESSGDGGTATPLSKPAAGSSADSSERQRQPRAGTDTSKRSSKRAR